MSNYLRTAPSGPTVQYGSSQQSKVLTVQPDGTVLPQNSGWTGLTVVRSTDLPALPNMTPGTPVWVQSKGCVFETVPAATAATEDDLVINGTASPVQYIFQSGSSNPAFQLTNTWNIDSVNGSNDGDGVTIPLKTVEELQRRLGPNAVLQNSTTINLSGTFTNFALKASPASENVKLTITASPTDYQAPTTVATVTNYAHGTHGSVGATMSVLTAAGIADWTTAVAAKVRLRAVGASAEHITWLTHENPHAGGANTAGTGQWFRSALANGEPVGELPTVGDALHLETLNVSIDHFTLDFQGANASANSQVEVRNIFFNKSINGRFGSALYAKFIGCQMGTSCRNNAFPQGSSDTNRPVEMIGCRHGEAWISPDPSLTYAVVDVELKVAGRGKFLNCHFANSGAVYRYGSDRIDHVGNQYWGARAQRENASGPTYTSLVSGNTSACAWNWAPGSRWYQNSTSNVTGAPEVGFKGDGSVVLGTTGCYLNDVSTGSVVIGEWDGQGVLTNGQLQVTLAPAMTFYFPTGSRIHVSYIGKASATMGPLDVASVTTSGFYVVGTTGDSTSRVQWSVRSAAWYGTLIKTT